MIMDSRSDVETWILESFYKIKEFEDEHVTIPVM